MVILAWCTGIPSIVILSPNIRLWHSTTRDTDTMSRSSAHRLPPERTRTVLISSSCGYDQDNSHKVTNNDLLFVLSSTRPARHSTLDNRLPPRSLNLKTYSIHHSPRLASSPHLRPDVVVPPQLQIFSGCMGRLYSCRLQNSRAQKYYAEIWMCARDSKPLKP